MTFKAIPTEYDGVQYRSRTEAKWAFFFTRNEIPFDYEPEGFEMDGLRYLPDFYLPIGKCWFEVKPDQPNPLELRKALKLAKGTRKLVFIAPGAPQPYIGLHAVSPSGKMQSDWQFAEAHEAGVGYLTSDLDMCELQIKIRDTEAGIGFYGGLGPECALKEAGEHQFMWRNERAYDGDRAVIRRPRGRLIEVQRSQRRFLN